jgi:hypothetical protein
MPPASHHVGACDSHHWCSTRFNVNTSTPGYPEHVGGLPQRAHGILSQNPETFYFQTAPKSFIVYYTQRDC